MASVVRDPRGRSPYWYACYTDATGRRLKKSTGLTAKSKALEMARRLDKAALEAKQGTLTEARARALLGEILQSVSGQTLRVFSVAEWLSHFVKQKLKSRAAKTALRHEQMMNEFIEFLGPRARLNIAAITPQDISDFRDHRHSRGLTPTTVNLDVTVLSAAFNAALNFTLEQISAVLKVAKGEWKGLILTAFYTGQRLGDCVSLRWRDIELVSKIKTIRFQPGKTGGEVVTVIHPALEKYFLSLPSSDDENAFLFPSLAEQAQRNVSPLSKEFRKLMEQAHIEQRAIRDRNKAGRTVYALSFHSLRHSFSSILANAGVSEERRMALTGHRSRDMHQHYSHHELEQLQKAVALLPAL
jgi:integrase